MRVLNHHVPPATLVALVYDYVAAAASVYIAGFLRFGATWPTQGDMHPSLPKALLFGAATALQFQLPALGIAIPNALLIMLPYLLALLAVGGLVGRQMAPATLGEPYRR